MSAFEDELRIVLPDDLPHREILIQKSALHLELIEQTNRQFNLTRITSPRDAAIKHVLDSVLPWRHFQDARHIMDAGAGAGFPGLPLALALPEIHFALTESTGKKARFIESTVAQLELPNVKVVNARAEDWLRDNSPDLITGRALAPLTRACEYFANAIRRGARVLLYKGPDAETEIGEAATLSCKNKIAFKIIEHYELPDHAGVRTLVQMSIRS